MALAAESLRPPHGCLSARRCDVNFERCGRCIDCETANQITNVGATWASGVIAVAVMCSRLLGLVREMLFAGLFGSALMGIFTIAFRAPNLLRDLFAEGALSTAFITVFSQKIEKEGDRPAWALASKMMTLAAIFMSIVSLLGVVFAKQLIDVLAPGFAPEDAKLTIQSSQIMRAPVNVFPDPGGP